MFSSSLVMQGEQILIAGLVFMLSVLELSILTIVATSFISLSAVASIADIKTNQTNSSEMSGKNKMMPGGNMTFGASLENAKMHLMEAIMDLKIGNTNGAMMQLNMSNEEIKKHEQEMMNMTTIMKGKMSFGAMGSQNTISIQ
jgi:hypothetical protein